VTSRVLHYTGAVAAVIIATLATSFLENLLGPSGSALFFPAVVIPAIYGGYGPALLATVLSTISLAYFFMVPRYSPRLGADDALRLAVLLAVACATAWLSAARRRGGPRGARRARVIITGRRTHTRARPA
jgi:two-component system sensor histidine kinase KdpD